MGSRVAVGHFAEPCWAWRAEQAGIRAGTRSIWAIVQCWAAGGFYFSEGKRKCEKLEPENSFLPSLFFFFWTYPELSTMLVI